tara:strand:+ start:205 stop:498 length:294 start_codon:yes stop_codon:yes gene_type:complete
MNYNKAFTALLLAVGMTVIPCFASASSFNQVTTQDVYGQLHNFVLTIDETVNSSNYFESVVVMSKAVEDLSSWLTGASRYASDPNARLLAGVILSNF